VVHSHARDELAKVAHLALSRYIEFEQRERPSRSFGLSRRIAFTALFCLGSTGLELSDAMDIAGRLSKLDSDVTDAYFRKCKSEARALVSAVLTQGRLPPPSDDHSFFAEIEHCLAALSVAEVTRRRAANLQGARGGPRAKHELLVLRSVRALDRRACSGDRHALAELGAIERYLRERQPSPTPDGSAAVEASRLKPKGGQHATSPKSTAPVYSTE